MALPLFAEIRRRELEATRAALQERVAAFSAETVANRDKLVWEVAWDVERLIVRWVWEQVLDREMIQRVIGEAAKWSREEIDQANQLLQAYLDIGLAAQDALRALIDQLTSRNVPVNGVRYLDSLTEECRHWKEDARVGLILAHADVAGAIGKRLEQVRAKPPTGSSWRDLFPAEEAPHGHGQH
jgi:hypothetical protein